MVSRRPHAMWMMLITLIFIPIAVLAEDIDPVYEDIPILVRIQNIGGTEINALYEYESGQIFISISELFQFLQIKHEFSPDMETISGFLIAEEKSYIINYTEQIIWFNNSPYPIKKGDLLKSDIGLFIKSSLLGDIFGLHTNFDFRSLSAEIKTDLELPAIRELRLAQLRRNINFLRGEIEVDTTILRKYNLFRFGSIDWGINSTQYTRNQNDTRLTFGIGAELLGGETNIQLQYSSRDGFPDHNQLYYWRWANNQSQLLRQVRIGKINPGSISSIFHPVIGITATNASTTYRRSFGEYNIAEYTEPGWTVELYINNVLVDYQTADASGFYSFNIPLVYGSSQITKKFYGPYGEERTQEQFMNIPFNFLPKGELEYKLTGGIVQNHEQARFGRAEAFYGIHRTLTMGGGIEYLSSMDKDTELPFISVSFTPFRNMMVSGELSQNVRTKLNTSYRLPSNLMVEFDYIKYKPGQQVILLNYLEERKATFATPLNFRFFRGYTRGSYRQIVHESLTYNVADFTLSTFAGPVNANLTTYATWIDNRKPFVYGNLTGGIRFGRGYMVRPRGQFDITNQSIVLVRTEVEKRLSRSGYFAIAGENNFRANYRSIEFSLRWDMPFAQTNFSARYNGTEFMTTQGARGSLAFGSGNNYIHVSNRSSIGRGGIAITPFLDINHNGVHDPNEPLVTGIAVRINGGRMLKNMKDTIIRISELEPYTSYVIELDDTGLEEIAWKLVDKKLRIHIDPNQFKKINIPILPMGEVNGWVFLDDGKRRQGQGRILINIYSHAGEKVTQLMTEADGVYYHLGLAPGKYSAAIDSIQLERIGMYAEPRSIEFNIEEISYGDIVYDLGFVIRPQELLNSTPVESEKNTDEQEFDEKEPVKTEIKPTDNETDKYEIPEPVLKSPGYAIQTGAFRNKENAENLLLKMSSKYDHLKFNVIFEDGWYKVKTEEYMPFNEAAIIRDQLINDGIDVFIIRE